MDAVVGIDLGTTFSAVAYVNDLGKPEILLNREGERITPSVVLFQGDAPLVGSMAKRSAATAPLDVVQFVKREMGNPAWKFQTSSGDSYRPEDVSAIILKRLREDAELTLGEGSVTDAVITVPAYFDDARRKATMDAGTIAGLNVRRVLNEPTAAALAYGLDSQVGGTLLVYDLGGGTFDVTVMRVGDGEFDVLATGGDRNLGGFNWDSELMQHLNAKLREQGGPDLLEDDALEVDLRDKAEIAKRTLTTVAKTSVTLGADGFTAAIPITREEFEDLTAGLLGRTRDITLMVLADACLTWANVDKLLMVGGSTRMPMVKAMMESQAQKPAERSINPDEVVALGAAVQARLVQDESDGETLPELRPDGRPIVIRDVTSQSLGVVAIDENSGRLMNSIIVPHNSKIPTKKSNIYSTVNDSQTVIEVQVTEGDDEDLDYVQIVGSKELTIPSYPKGAPIEIFFAYDIDQTIFVEVHDLTTKVPLGSFEIDRIANLNDHEVEDRRVKIDRLEVN